MARRKSPPRRRACHARSEAGSQGQRELEAVARPGAEARADVDGGAEAHQRNAQHQGADLDGERGSGEG